MKKYFKKFTVMVIALTMILASSVSVFANTLKQTAYTQIHLETGYILGSYHPKKDPVKFSMTQKLGDIKVTHIGHDGYYYYEFFPKKQERQRLQLSQSMIILSVLLRFVNITIQFLQSKLEVRL